MVCEAIDSVLQQTYSKIEIIVVDDGSTDDTQQRLRAYGKSARVITQDNAGPSAARNRGIELSRGEIVAFLDSDDIWKPTKIERQVRLLQAVGRDVPCCLCNADVHHRDGRMATSFDYAGLTPTHREGLWSNVAEILATQFLMFTQMIAVRRSVLQKLGGFNEGLHVLEDYDLALRLSTQGEWAYISDPLVIYRGESPGSLAVTGQSDEWRLLERGIEVRQRFSDTVHTDPRLRFLRHSCVHGLEAFKRQLRALERSRDVKWSQALLGRCALRMEHYRRALYRRSPWYPKMKVSPVCGLDD